MRYILAITVALLHYQLARRGLDYRVQSSIPIFFISSDWEGDRPTCFCLDLRVQPNKAVDALSSSSIPTTMLLKRFPPPSGAGLFVSRSTAISPSHARRCRRVDFPTFMSTSTFTPTAQPPSAFPIRNSHPSILQSADLDSHPDIELEKHLGINRKVDRDPSSSQHHHHNSSFDSHDPNSSHNPSGGSRKYLSTDPGPSQPPRKSTGKKKMEITDREWDIRTGESFFGIHTLRQEFDATLQNLSHSMPYISAIIYSKTTSHVTHNSPR